MSGLKRKTPLVRRPKAKGNAYEKHISERLRRFFPTAKRNLGSGGYGGGDLVETPGWSFECKKVEALNLWKALAQSEEAASPTQTPAVVFARNRSRDYIAFPFDDWEGMMEEIAELRQSLKELA